MNKVEVTAGTLANVDGSAQWAQGATKVICSVSGPLEVKYKDELPNDATLELVVRPITGVSTTRETLIEERIFSAISPCILRKLHPRTLIQIVVQILESGEKPIYNVNEMAASINAAGVALIDAAIPLQGIPVACALAVVENSIVVDPSDYQLQNSQSTHVIAYEFRDDLPHRILLCESTGEFTEEQVMACLDEAVKICTEAYSSLSTAVEQRIERSFAWKK